MRLEFTCVLEYCQVSDETRWEKIPQYWEPWSFLHPCFCSHVAFFSLLSFGDLCDEMGISVPTVWAKKASAVFALILPTIRLKLKSSNKEHFQSSTWGSGRFLSESENVVKTVDAFMVPFFSGLKPKGQIVTLPGDVGKGTEMDVLFSIWTLTHLCLGWGVVCLLGAWLWARGLAQLRLCRLSHLSIPLHLLLFLTFSFLFPSDFSS